FSCGRFRSHDFLGFRGGFLGLEGDLAMAAVAKRLALGMPASAQGNVFLTYREREFVSQVIHDLEICGQNQGTIFTAADGQDVRHWCSFIAQEARSASKELPR